MLCFGRGCLPIVFPPKTMNSARAKLFQDFAPSAINHPPSTTIDHLCHQSITPLPGRSAPLSSNRRHPCAGIDRCLNERASGTIFPMPSRWKKSGKCVPRCKKHVLTLVCYTHFCTSNRRHHRHDQYWPPRGASPSTNRPQPSRGTSTIIQSSHGRSFVLSVAFRCPFRPSPDRLILSKR